MIMIVIMAALLPTACELHFSSIVLQLFVLFMLAAARRHKQTITGACKS
jgi:hypothetical protein